MGLGSFKFKIKLLSLASKKKGMGAKWRYLHYANLAIKNNVINFRVDRVASEYLDDYMADTGIKKEDKEWYYSRGIASFKAQWYGLTKENYKNYISDFDFYNKCNYMNRDFENWFEHKLNTYYLLAPFKKYMPKHYYFIRQGEILPIDVEKKVNGAAGDILELIKKQPLAFKACVGGHGKGFYKLYYTEGLYYVNNQRTSEHDVIKFIDGLDNYIVTEYGIPHSVFQEACGEEAFAVIRTVTVYDKKEGPQLTAAIIRLGSKNAGIVTDYDGTIYCGVSLDDGRLFNPICRTGDNEGIIKRISMERHPDTGRKIDNIVIPNFKVLEKLVKDISAYLPSTPYLVMDIIPTENGFEILEINSHGQVRVVEPFYPFNLNSYNREIFQIQGK